MYNVFQNNGTLVHPKLALDKEAKKKDNVISANTANMVAIDPLSSAENLSGYVYSMHNLNFLLATKTGTAGIKDKRDIDGKENSSLLALDRSNNRFLTVIMAENSGKDGSATDISKPLIDYLEAAIK